MKQSPHPLGVYATAVVFLAYSLSACTAAVRPAKELAKYDEYEFADQATFNRSYVDTYRAAIASLEDMGFTITLTDESAGTIQAEAGTTALRPEETGVALESEESGGGFLAALVVVLVAILVFFVGGDNDQVDEVVVHEPERSPQRLHVYVMALDLRSEEPGRTVVTIGASRYDYEDADLVGSMDLENKYLNHGLFDRIEEHLTVFENPVDQPGGP